MLGVALTVAYALSTGFDRAARAADLPTVVARFGDQDAAAVDAPCAALPNLAAASYRYEQTRRAAERAAAGRTRRASLADRARRAARLRARRRAATCAGRRRRW